MFAAVLDFRLPDLRSAFLTAIALLAKAVRNNKTEGRLSELLVRLVTPG